MIKSIWTASCTQLQIFPIGKLLSSYSCLSSIIDIIKHHARSITHNRGLGIPEDHDILCRSKLNGAAKKNLRHIRAFDRRIKGTVILTSVKNTIKPQNKFSRLVLTGNKAIIHGNMPQNKIFQHRLVSTGTIP